MQSVNNLLRGCRRDGLSLAYILNNVHLRNMCVPHKSAWFNHSFGPQAGSFGLLSTSTKKNESISNLINQAAFSLNLYTDQFAYTFVIKLCMSLSLSLTYSGRGGVSGNKFRTTLALPVSAVMNCADNTGAKNLYVVSVTGVGGRLNRLPAATVGDMIMATVKKG